MVEAVNRRELVRRWMVAQKPVQINREQMKGEIIEGLPDISLRSLRKGLTSRAEDAVNSSRRTGVPNSGILSRELIEANSALADLMSVVVEQARRKQ